MARWQATQMVRNGTQCAHGSTHSALLAQFPVTLGFMAHQMYCLATAREGDTSSAIWMRTKTFFSALFRLWMGRMVTLLNAYIEGLS